jgi:hypothetical protein
VLGDIAIGVILSIAAIMFYRAYAENHPLCFVFSSLTIIFVCLTLFYLVLKPEYQRQEQLLKKEQDYHKLEKLTYVPQTKEALTTEVVTVEVTYSKSPSGEKIPKEIKVFPDGKVLWSAKR